MTHARQGPSLIVPIRFAFDSYIDYAPRIDDKIGGIENTPVVQ